MSFEVLSSPLAEMFVIDELCPYCSRMLGLGSILVDALVEAQVSRR
jgi:hypothetical protein